MQQVSAVLIILRYYITRPDFQESAIFQQPVDGQRRQYQILGDNRIFDRLWFFFSLAWRCFRIFTIFVAFKTSFSKPNTNPVKWSKNKVRKEWNTWERKESGPRVRDIPGKRFSCSVIVQLFSLLEYLSISFFRLLIFRCFFKVMKRYKNQTSFFQFMSIVAFNTFFQIFLKLSNFEFFSYRMDANQPTTSKEKEIPENLVAKQDVNAHIEIVHVGLTFKNYYFFLSYSIFFLKSRRATRTISSPNHKMNWKKWARKIGGGKNQ